MTAARELDEEQERLLAKMPLRPRLLDDHQFTIASELIGMGLIKMQDSKLVLCSE